jgi:peroxiredoxin
MTIKVGDTIPSVTLKRLGSEGMEEVTTDAVFKGKKVVAVFVPGAFTPTCSSTHLPGYIESAAALKSKGVDEIVCVAVNDPWVMKAWGEEMGATGKVTMLPDGNGELTKQLGLEADLTVANLGTRSKRLSMVVEDSVVKSLDIEDGPGVNVSGADTCLARL